LVHTGVPWGAPKESPAERTSRRFGASWCLFAALFPCTPRGALPLSSWSQTSVRSCCPTGQAVPASAAVTRPVRGCDVFFPLSRHSQEGPEAEGRTIRFCCWVFGDSWGITSILCGGQPWPQAETKALQPGPLETRLQPRNFWPRNQGGLPKRTQAAAVLCKLQNVRRWGCPEQKVADLACLKSEILSSL